METNDINFSLTSDTRIQKLLEEADNELKKIQPEIEYLESCVTKLDELKLKKNKLLSLMASLKVILTQSNKSFNDIKATNKNVTNTSSNLFTSSLTDVDITYQNVTLEHNLFIPELALNQVKQFLRINNNLNYEIFKSVVFNAGEATTEEIKDYLVKNKVRQPKTGKYFDEVELKDISSRANYLVRKKLLITVGPGIFKSTLGYTTET